MSYHSDPSPGWLQASWPSDSQSTKHMADPSIELRAFDPTQHRDGFVRPVGRSEDVPLPAKEL